MCWAADVEPRVAPTARIGTGAEQTVSNAGVLTAPLLFSGTSFAVRGVENVGTTAAFFIAVGLGDTQEIMLVHRQSYDVAAKAMTVDIDRRGCWDTVARTHAQSTVWIPLDDTHLDATVYNSGTPANLTATVTSDAVSVDVTETLTPSASRLAKPFAPGELSASGTVNAHTHVYTGAVTMTWRNRSRSMTRAQYIANPATASALETNQSTRVTISRGSTQVLQRTTTAATITVSAADMRTAVGTTSLRGGKLTVESIRGTDASWQRWERDFAWRENSTISLSSGWGYDWGESWGS